MNTMFRAMFITTDTVDCDNHVKAWESAFGRAIVWKYNIHALRNDWQALEIADTLVRSDPSNVETY